MIYRFVLCDQAHYCMSGCVSEGYGKKHILFIKWKYLEAKVPLKSYNNKLCSIIRNSVNFVSQILIFDIIRQLHITIMA